MIWRREQCLCRHECFVAHSSAHICERVAPQQTTLTCSHTDPTTPSINIAVGTCSSASLDYSSRILPDIHLNVMQGNALRNLQQVSRAHDTCPTGMGVCCWGHSISPESPTRLGGRWTTVPMGTTDRSYRISKGCDPLPPPNPYTYRNNTRFFDLWEPLFKIHGRSGHSRGNFF